MTTLSQLSLTFLLNALWQIALIGLAAALADRLLRRTQASYRHLLWVMALALSLLLPLIASLSSLRGTASAALPRPESFTQILPAGDLPASAAPEIASRLNSGLQISARMAAGAGEEDYSGMAKVVLELARLD